MTVMAIFNIGTGHTQVEVNNTIAALGNACTSSKKVNDGVGAGIHKLDGFWGWGMNQICKATMDEIRRQQPDQVVMTGHSRGAIICHMIAHEIFMDPVLKHSIKIYMILLDPVHQSKEEHLGAEELDINYNLICYHSIVMADEQQNTGGKSHFPYKFPTATAMVAQRMHFIPMPGQHGSGSQNLTSPIGKVCFELILDFMKHYGVQFGSLAQSTPIQMCDHFAEIHEKNPVRGGVRLLFDDAGTATVHDVKKQVWGGPSMRAPVVRRANELNEATFYPCQPNPRLRELPSRYFLGNPSEYFFNMEHMYYFELCFPYLYSLFMDSPMPWNFLLFQRDWNLVRSSCFYLGENSPFLLECLRPHLQPLDFAQASAWVNTATYAPSFEV